MEKGFIVNRWKLGRRLFLQAAGGSAAALVLGGAADAPDPSVAARKQAARRKRRIIMNNDGNDAWGGARGDPKTPENFLAKRTSPLLGSQVDAIFYCTGVFNVYTHRSRETELRADRDPEKGFVKALHDLGTDPLEVMVKYCREHGLEVFWSMRMNDTHDSGKDSVLCQWKQDHPEYLVGRRDQEVGFPYGCNRWSSVDYGIPEVREKVYRILQDVCTRYDVDGIELDFFRHPVLFRPQMTGQPVTQEHSDLLTELIRRMRAMTESIGRKRNRPMLVAIRVPDSVGYCKAIGIDLVRWLDDDLVDIVVGSDYFKLEPWENLAAFGRKYETPVYACFESRRIMNGGRPEETTAIKVWRGEALNAWKAGVDGIYTFNRFNPNDVIFRELGDPALLETLERVDQTVYVADIWSRPETWLKDGDKYVQEPGK